ncbi:MAG: hypothetical protein QXX12_06430 [Nanopusillaceae archaeon]
MFLKDKLKQLWQKREVKELPFLLLALLLAYILRAQPPTEPKVSFSLAQNETNNYTSNNTQIKESHPQSDTSRQERARKAEPHYNHLARRNPFTPEGSYSEMIIPETPYNLVAILVGKEKRALLRFFTGELRPVKEGDILIDGAKVLKIDKDSVIIERLGKKKELRLFKVEVERWKIKK